MLEVSLPWPHSSLFPNAKARAHWSAHRKPAKLSRTLAFGLTAQALGPKRLRSYCGGGCIPDGHRLTIRIAATPPLRPGRVPDDDGIQGACKHYLDGIADALGVDDKRFRIEAVEWLPKAGAGEIRISF